MKMILKQNSFNLFLKFVLDERLFEKRCQVLCTFINCGISYHNNSERSIIIRIFIIPTILNPSNILTGSKVIENTWFFINIQKRT